MTPSSPGPPAPPPERFTVRPSGVVTLISRVASPPAVVTLDTRAWPVPAGPWDGEQ